MDSLGFIAPARIRVLLVPVPPIKQSTFTDKVKLLKTFDTIPLGDVTPDLRSERTLFNPHGFVNGQIQFNFVTSYNKEHAYLTEFQPFRRIMGVIGIMDCREWTDLEEGYKAFLKIISYYPQALSYRCFAFDPKDQPDDTKGLIMIPNVGNIEFYMKTMVCDFSRSLLTAFGNMVEEYENRGLFSSPKEEIIPQLPENLLYSPHSSLVNLNQPVNAYSSNRISSIPSMSENVNGRLTPPPHAMQKSQTGTIPPTSPSGHLVYNSVQRVIDSKLRKKTPGRFSKLMGDLFLLAGRPRDAVANYNECINITKSNGDYLWHASALEGFAIALTLLEYLHIEYPTSSTTTPVSTPTTPTPSYVSNALNEILDKVSQAITLYLRSESIPGEEAPRLLICEAALRTAKLLSIIWSVGEWGDKTLSLIVSDSMKAAEKQSNTVLISIPQSPISRTEVSEWATRAAMYLPAIPSVMDKLFLITGITNIFGKIGFKRKHAYFLRQTTGLMLPLLVQARISVTNPSAFKSNQVIRSYGGHDGDESILTCLDEFSKVYGIGDLQANALNALQQRGIEDILQNGWPELQVEVLKEAISLSEALPDYKSLAKYTARLLQKFHAFLAREEQISLSLSLPQITLSALKQNQLFSLESWGNNLVKSIEICESSTRKKCLSHPVSELIGNLSTTQTNPINTNPFIYNPYETKIGRPIDQVLVQNETAEFIVTLENPYLFDLEIPMLSLSTSGLEFINHSSATIIAPQTLMAVHVTGIAREKGTLSIRGCKAKIANMSEREFLMPFPPEKAEMKKITNELELCERLKRTGIDSLMKGANELVKIESDFKFPNILVLPEQPLLQVKETNLRYGALMLFEGEEFIIRISLTNISNTPVDYVKLSFSDSTISPSQEALTNPDISLEEQYELELFLHRSNVFKWDAAKEGDRAASVSIQPKETYELEVKCFGKMGCTGGTIQIHYGYVGRETSTVEEKSLFYTRQLEIPVLLTVTHALESILVDVLHLQYLERGKDEPDSMMMNGGRWIHGLDHVMKAITSDQEASEDYALLSLDIINRWHQPFETTFTISQTIGDTEVISATTLATANATTRMIIPIRRMQLGEEVTRSPIPSIIDKQYVVPKRMSTTRASELERLELFWYREELLKRLSGNWKEPSTGRSGKIDLRHLRLNRTLLRVIKVDSVRIRVKCENVKNVKWNKYNLQANEFFKLIFTVENHRAENLKLFLRIMPVNAYGPPLGHENGSGTIVPRDIMSKRFIHHGVMQTPLPRLAPGASISHVLPVCFLSKGTYKFLYHVEEIPIQQNGTISPDENIYDRFPDTIHYEKDPLTIVIT